MHNHSVPRAVMSMPIAFSGEDVSRDGYPAARRLALEHAPDAAPFSCTREGGDQ